MQSPTPTFATAPLDSRCHAVEAVLAGTSPLALELVRAVERAGDARTVVVRGPAGSGRRQVAQALHRLGAERLSATKTADAGATFVRCAGLTGTWGVQRLLGTRDEAGLFDVARGGTLVLVDAETLEHDVQSSIAEALGRGAFTPLGARAPRALDLRLVALTSDEDLERVLAPELAYRLNDHAVHVPSLALRAADLPDITRVLLAASGGPQLSAAAALELSSQVWIGGIDELAELVARAARAAGAGPIEPRHLGERRGPSASPAALLATDSLPLLDRSWRAVEKALIERVLLENDGNKSRAARVLGFNRSTLYHKLAEHGLA
jgi:DNA-binding NtrC family response regulator